MKRLALFFLFCFPLALPAQLDSAKKVTITGRLVTNDAKIILRPPGNTYFTDEKGYFVLDTIPAGTYSLKIGAPGFHSRTLDNMRFDKSQQLPEIIELKARRFHMPEWPSIDFDPFVFEGTLAVQQGWRTMGEVAIGLGLYEAHSFLDFDIAHIQLGTTFNFTPEQLILGPGITFLYSPLLIDVGGSLRYYTTKNTGTLYVSPHFGINFIYADLFMGYEIPLTKNVMKPWVNRFTVTLAVPLHKTIW